ncbi:MAG TPA: hypothetical protein VKJ83_06865, partial [Actinomycetota bacterium]|nr:hypothetical protein [Actinomycetota bacterium]
MGSQPAGHVGVGGLAEVQSSGPKSSSMRPSSRMMSGAVAWRLEADVAADADGLGVAPEARRLDECSAGGVEFVSLILEPANGQRFG